MWVFVRVEWEAVKKAEAAKQANEANEAGSGEGEDYELVTAEDQTVVWNGKS